MTVEGTQAALSPLDKNGDRAHNNRKSNAFSTYTMGVDKFGAGSFTCPRAQFLIRHDDGKLETDRFLREIADAAGRVDMALAQEIQSLETMLSWDEDRAIAELHKHSSVRGMPIRDLILTSIYAFIKSPNSYKDSVLFCVNAGWDTDTMAAICGNISGAFNGIEGVPEQWLKCLENDYKGRDYLLRLADCLHHHTKMEDRLNPVVDYAYDFTHNTLFLTQMLLLKPMY